MFPWPSFRRTNFVDDLLAFQKLQAMHLYACLPHYATTAFSCRGLSRLFRRAAHGIAATKSFLADKSTDKRARLIDTLLERPEFADFLGLEVVGCLAQ